MATGGEKDPAWNTVELRAPVEQVLRDLDAIPKAWARTRNRRRAVTFTVLGGVALCAVAGGVLSGGVALLAMLLAFGLAVGLLFHRLGWTVPLHEQWMPAFAPDRRRLLAVRVLQRLQGDLPPGAPVHLRLVPLPRPNGPGSGASRPSYWTERPADGLDAWLLLETRLADGAHLRLRAVERRRHRPTRWQGRDARYLRTKARDVLFVDVQLRVKPRRHPLLASLTEARALPAVRLPRDVKLQRLRIAEDRLRLRVRLADPYWVAVVPREVPGAKRGPYHGPDVSRTVTLMLLSLYQLLHVARFPLSPPAPPPPKPVRAPLAKPERGRKKRRGRNAV
ncbi:hypothetical protein [Corallococcus exercitus]|uniref:hypothetical protein n=1 Tax=Corallococcus exercitus TaxID=2316736 RepID=UPI0035D46855